VTNEHDLRDFLLGRFDEAQAEPIENRLLEDPDFFDVARSIEDDLFDDFARGLLNEEERAAFLRRYADRVERIQFARALAKRDRKVLVFPSTRWIALAAAAAIAIAVTQLLIHTSQTPAVRPQQTQVRPILRSIAVTIPLGGSRSESKAALVVVPRDVSTVKLRVRLNPADRYDGYVMTLRSKNVSWGSGQVHAAMDAGDLIVSADVPAKILEPGTYEVAVSGAGEEIGFATMEVHRTQ
jgi:hypothetical protein